MITFDNNDVKDVVAYIVENDLILEAVRRELKPLENVDVLYESKINGYKLPTQAEGEAEVKLESGSTFTCDLLVSTVDINNIL